MNKHSAASCHVTYPPPCLKRAKVTPHIAERARLKTSFPDYGGSKLENGAVTRAIIVGLCPILAS